MKNEIIEKLNKFLTDRNSYFQEECEVVYFLVEIRKILEHLKDNKLYSTLRFYADWALHTEKSQYFPEEIKNLVPKAAKSIVSHEESFASLENLFLDFLALKDDIKKFLTENNLPVNLVENEGLWENFTSLYGAIISDQPLKLSTTNKEIIIITARKEGNTVYFNTKTVKNY